MRFQLTLPAIDYGSDSAVEYPLVSNRLIDLPDRFARWGTESYETPVHCFVDDWRIEAIWRDKYKMTERVVLSGFAVAPDYTVEHDAPLVHAVHQVWRSRVIARYWQDHGVYVVPALQWSRQSINPWLFAGLEQCQVVAVRSPTRGAETEWRQCAEQFLAIHKPALVLHFGTKKGFDVWPNAVNLSLKSKKSKMMPKKR